VAIRKNEEYVAQIRKVAASMHELYQELENLNLCGDCGSFTLPHNPTPLRQGGLPPANPYPGGDESK